MDAHAAFGATLASNNAHETGLRPAPVAAVGGAESDDVYASLMSKEHAVLDLIRRVDDTKREEALQTSDKIAPLARAFIEGFSKFVARLLHYASSGAHGEVIGLVSSPDGMVYVGIIVAVLGITLHVIV